PNEPDFDSFSTLIGDVNFQDVGNCRYFHEGEGQIIDGPKLELSGTEDPEFQETLISLHEEGDYLKAYDLIS
ncbi:MAG: hypothetical protein IIC01_11150, partial [Planctomycetes bacterium]|nr:hypothetical protein [Planctomycetota bacterium]